MPHMTADIQEMENYYRGVQDQFRGPAGSTIGVQWVVATQPFINRRERHCLLGGERFAWRAVAVQVIRFSQSTTYMWRN